MCRSRVCYFFGFSMDEIFDAAKRKKKRKNNTPNMRTDERHFSHFPFCFFFFFSLWSKLKPCKRQLNIHVIKKHIFGAPTEHSHTFWQCAFDAACFEFLFFLFLLPFFCYFSSFRTAKSYTTNQNQRKIPDLFVKMRIVKFARAHFGCVTNNIWRCASNFEIETLP